MVSFAVFFPRVSSPGCRLEAVNGIRTTKMKDQLRALLRSGRVKRKLLEQVLGLLIWATSLSLELRAWLAPLYSDRPLDA